MVESIAARDGLDEAAAAHRAAQTLALARAYAGAHGDDAARALPPARRAHLRRNALARLWLQRDFEARNSPQTVPAPMVKAALDDPRALHPRLHHVCQVLVTPPFGPDRRPVDIPDDPDWRPDALPVAESVAAHLRRYVRDPGAEPDCDHVFAVALLEPKPREGLVVRAESGVFEACRPDLWDAGFVDAICPQTEPGIYGPFWTRYGAHVAVVVKVQDDNRPEDEATRLEMASQFAVDAWRRHRYPTYIERMRARFDARLLRAPRPAPRERP